MIHCPKCDSNDIYNFERSVYITHKDGAFHPVSLYGCRKCNILFTSITKSDPNNDEKGQTIEKIQHIFGDISKGCNKILSNIK
jgi:hypothetical protein